MSKMTSGLHCYLDFGNSRVKAWLCRHGEVISRVSHGYQLDVGSFFRVMPAEFRQPMAFVGVASVLDSDADAAFVEQARHWWGVTPMFAESHASDCGLMNGYEQPSQLGVDRWMNILGVSRMAPSYCVVSCGTALTIDLVCNRQHAGGYIMPGMFLQLTSLVKGTRKVRPELSESRGVQPGRTTTEAVYHGVVLSQVCVIERCFDLLKSREASDAKLILTGGDADKLSPHLACPHDIMPELVLLGLQSYFGFAVSQE